MGFTKKSDYRNRETDDDSAGKPADRIDPDEHHSLYEYEQDNDDTDQ